MHNFVTMQNDVNDCGPAVIYSLVKYYKGYVSMEKIRLDTNLDKEGPTAYDIVLTLKNYGFEANGLKLTLKDLKEVSRPMILHFSYSHYVLLVKVNKDKATIMDPSKGLIKMSLSELNSVWSGVAITAIPSNAIIKMDKSTSLLSLLKKLISENKKTVIVIVILGIFLNILSLILNYYLQFLISFSNYLKVLLLFLTLTILKIIVECNLATWTLSLSRNIDYLLQNSYIKHFLHLPLPTLEKATSGRTLKHIEDLNLIKEAVLELLLKVSLTLLQSFFGLILLIKINKHLSLVLFTIMFLYSILKTIENKKVRKNTGYLLEKTTTYEEELIETIKGYKTIKDLHKEDYYGNNLLQKTLDYLDYQKYYGKFLNRWQGLENILLELGNFVLISYGFILSKENIINLVNLFTFLTIANYLFYSLREVMTIMPKYYYLKQSYQRISEFLDTKEESDAGIDFVSGDIKFRHVSFTYNNGKQVIKNLNQVIKKGQKVILSGASGTGKSTLCKLLYRYYSLSAGSITINDIDIKDIKLSSLRNNISYVSQESILFEKTILENIVDGSSIEPDKLKEILKICRLDKLIATLPNHLATSLKGNNLSGGEIERVILARSLYNLKPILILDEALSQVDIKTEIAIIKDIQEKYKACTLIYITHKDVEDVFTKKLSFSK